MAGQHITWHFTLVKEKNQTHVDMSVDRVNTGLMVVKEIAK